MGFIYNGQYGPTAILDAAGQPVANQPVTVYVGTTTGSSGTLATLYQSYDSTTTVSNPVSTDSYGNLTFFAEPGQYTLYININGIVTTYTVTVQPWPADIQNILNQQATDVNNITTLQNQLNSLGNVYNVDTPGIDIPGGGTANNVITGTVNYAGWYFVGIQFMWGTTSGSTFTEVSAFVYGPGVDGYGIGGGSHYTSGIVGGVIWPFFAQAPVYFNGSGQVGISIDVAGASINLISGAGWIVPITAQE
jgi:hypothetical protein